MRKHFFSIAFLIAFGAVFSQEVPGVKFVPPPKNNIYVELAGKSFYGSVGWERYLVRKKRNRLSFTAGLGMGPALLNDNINPTVPLSFNYYSGSERNKFHVGTFLTTYIDFTPYPSTYAARKKFLHDVSQPGGDPSSGGHWCWQNGYSPLFSFATGLTFGWKHYFKNNHAIGIDVLAMLIQNLHPWYEQNCRLIFTGVPWLGINYSLPIPEKPKKNAWQ